MKIRAFSRNLKNIEIDFRNLVKRLQEYKDGKFDVLEKASDTVRILDVM